MGRSIREVMTESPSTVSPHDRVVDAARLMRDEDVGAIPIVEEGRLVGMLTDRDVAVRLVAEGRDPAGAQVSEIASRELVTIDPQQELSEAMLLMAEHQVRRLPVVEEDGRLVGIVAQADVARAADESRVGGVVGDISE